LKDGKVKDLQVTMSQPEHVVDMYRSAIKRYPRSPAFVAELDDTEAQQDEG